jgi:hypothetical protein
MLMRMLSLLLHIFVPHSRSSREPLSEDCSREVKLISIAMRREYAFWQLLVRGR